MMNFVPLLTAANQATEPLRHTRGEREVWVGFSDIWGLFPGPCQQGRTSGRPKSASRIDELLSGEEPSFQPPQALRTQIVGRLVCSTSYVIGPGSVRTMFVGVRGINVEGCTGTLSCTSLIMRTHPFFHVRIILDEYRQCRMFTTHSRFSLWGYGFCNGRYPKDGYRNDVDNRVYHY